MAGWNPFKTKFVCIPPRGLLKSTPDRVKNLMELAKTYKVHPDVKKRLSKTQISRNFQ